jgi:hypothetical protein
MSTGMMPEMVRAMMESMLVLIVPSFLVVSGIAWLAWRRRDVTRND